ncbi:hypothetical protein IAT38_001167 [Cryptococcus sp. DSM 104549]
MPSPPPPTASHDSAPSFISSAFLSSAPTPNNTYCSPDVYDGQSLSQSQSHPSQLHSQPSYDSSDAMYNPAFSTDSHHLPIPGTSPSSSIRQTSFSSHASHASSRLLPTPITSFSGNTAIPHSSRPIPAPPMSLRSNPSILHQPLSMTGVGTGEAATPTTEASTIATPPAVKFGLDLGMSESRGSKDHRDVDAQRLEALGYNAVLGRQYTFWSSLAISWLNIGALQGTIFAVSGTYSYGGPIMILVAWPISGVFTIILTLTLSELASAYPVAGAMTSWAWKTARGGVGGERGWAWVIMGFVMGGHVGNILLVTWEIANIVVGTIGLSIDYDKKSWHNFLFFIAVLLIIGTVGSTGWGQSHRFWLCSGLFGFTMWLVLCITLLATNATKHDPSDMFKEFYNTTGWSSKAYVYILGWQFTTIASGADASAHMAEETQNPSRNVPNAMTASVIGTYVLGYISIVLLLLSIAPGDAATVKSHSFAFGYILTKAISKSGAITISCLMVVVLLLQVLAQLQASSRFVFAMARENAMPFSNLIKRTNSKRTPVFATWLVVVVCAPFACLTLASQSTLYSVLAVTACTMSYVGYAVPIALYLVSRIDLQTEGRSSWSLRRWSKPVGVVGLLYALAVVVTQTFPGSRPVTASTMSWSPVIIVGTCSICYLTWKLYGDSHFAGPIRALTKWESGVEIDLSTTLASSRSRQSHSAGSPGAGTGGETASSLKLALSPFSPSAPGSRGTQPTEVTVQSAAGTGMTSDGEWTSGSASGGTVSAWSRGGGEESRVGEEGKAEEGKGKWGAR